jgi:hypothetical protein
MTAQAAKPTKTRKPAPVKIRRPRPGTKSEAILTLAATTPATPPEIANRLHIPRQTVHHALKRYGIEPNRLDSFKKHRADVFADLQDRILSSVTTEDIQKTPAIQRITGAAILYDKERLERGQSTSNQAVIHADIAALRGAADDVSDPIET